MESKAIMNLRGKKKPDAVDEVQEIRPEAVPLHLLGLAYALQVALDARDDDRDQSDLRVDRCSD